MVCHMTSVHRHDDQRILFKECKALVEAGYEVHLIAHEAPSRTINRVKLHPVELIKASYGTWVVKTARVFAEEAYKINADLYHIHNAELLGAALSLKELNVPVVYDVFEDYQQVISSQPDARGLLGKIQAAFYARREKQLACKMDLIVGAAPDLLAKYHSSGCVTIEVCDFPTLEQLNTATVDFSAKEKAVCYIGPLARDFGLFEMIAAADQADLKLILAGDFISKIDRKHAQAQPGWSSVEVIPVLKREEIRRAIARSMAGIVVYHNIGDIKKTEPGQFGYYLSSGLPVIASDFPLWKKVFDEYACGFCVDPLDVDAIAGAMQLLSLNHERARSMSRQALQVALQKYNWEHERQNLIKVYQQLLR